MSQRNHFQHSYNWHFARERTLFGKNGSWSSLESKEAWPCSDLRCLCQTWTEDQEAEATWDRAIQALPREAVQGCLELLMHRTYEAGMGQPDMAAVWDSVQLPPWLPEVFDVLLEQVVGDDMTTAHLREMLTSMADRIQEVAV